MTHPVMPATPVIPALDGLRAVAIILVLFRHMIYMFSWVETPAGNDFFTRINDHLYFMLNGWIGVDLFFALSGFLIARPFVSGRKISIRDYALKRLLRIVPLYYVVILLCMVGAFPFYRPTVEGTGAWVSVLYHAVFLQDYLPSNINIVFWSLGVEEKFYLIAPLLVPGLLYLFRSDARRFLFVLGGLLGVGVALRWVGYDIAGSPQSYPEFFRAARSPFHACLDPLLVGVGVAFFEKYANDHVLNTRSIGRIAFWCGATGLAGLIFHGPMLAKLGVYDAVLQPLLIAFCMGGLVLGGVAGGAPTILGGMVLRVIAKISYSLYLVHLPLWSLAYALTILMTGDTIITSMGALALFGLIFLSLSIMVATILYLAVERPFLSLKARIDHR